MRQINSFPNTINQATFQNIEPLRRVSHNFSVSLIDIIKSFCFIRQLKTNVATHENTLEIQPLSLKIHPHFQNFGDRMHCAFPFLYNIEKRPDELRGCHAVYGQHVIFEYQIQFVKWSKNKAALFYAWKM